MRPDLEGKKRRPADRAASARAGGPSASVPSWPWDEDGDPVVDPIAERAKHVLFTSEGAEPSDEDPRAILDDILGPVREKNKRRLEVIIEEEGRILKEQEKAELIESGRTFVVDRLRLASRRLDGQSRKPMWEARCLIDGEVRLITANRHAIRDAYYPKLAGMLPRRFRLAEVDVGTPTRVRLLEPA